MISASATSCFAGNYLLITTSWKPSRSLMPRRGQNDRFRMSTWRPPNDDQAVRFERAQAMTEVTFVRVESAHQLLMTIGDHPTGPLVIRHQPPQDLVLELG
jgi:hypothetical protein